MLGPVHAQFSIRVKVSMSDRGFPALTSRSGSRPARRLRSRTTVGGPAPWSSCGTLIGGRGCYYDLVVVVAALRAGSRWLDAGH
jgi:hypothetical protein